MASLQRRRQLRQKVMRTNIYQPSEMVDPFTQTAMAAAPVITLRNIAIQNSGMQVMPEATYGDNCCTEADAALAYIQQRILDIIEAITLKMSLDDVIKMAVDLEVYVDKKAEVVYILEKIEHLITGIVGNIAQRVNFSIITNRINYLKEVIAQLETADATFEYCYDNTVAPLMLDIIQCITEEFNPDKLKSIIQELQISMNEQLVFFSDNPDFMKTLAECEFIIISIIENITNRVSLGLVLGRAKYLQELVKNCR
jgi:hypothetical protein